MSKKRIKRFVLKPKDDLKGLWASKQGELLTLSYDYAPSVPEDSIYRQMVEVAVGGFNSLGLAKLVYQPTTMGVYLESSPPPDAEYLKLKHGNPTLFSSYAVAVNESNPVCSARSNAYFYEEKIFIKDFFNESKTLPPFAEIRCNLQHEFFQRFGSGGILHEINHLFGIKHSHFLEETNGILAVNITKPDFDELNRSNFAKIRAVYQYGSFLQTSNYSLISPFSLQHYRITLLEPYRYFNRTRMSELLDLYQVGAEVKDNYFYLLDKYAGRFFLYTYQDILALASAIYHIAPDSLAGKKFNFLNYHFIEGMPMPEEDKLKFVEVINILSRVENRSYPILLQENSTEPCFITFLVNTTSNLEPNDSLDYSNRKSREASFLMGRQETASNSKSNLVEQINYCITVPFSQGVIEGVIDSTSLHAYVKSGLKVSPRILLWYWDYLNPMNVFLITGASFLEGAIKNSLKNKVTVPTERFISIVLFLSVAELEYGFSNLWTLADQPQFFPELTDKFNQLFLQWFFSPMIKTLGYTVAVSLASYCFPPLSKVQKDRAKSKSATPFLTSEHEDTLAQSVSMKSSFVAAMQDAYRTVFSRKTFKLFSFFKTNSTLVHGVSSSEEVSIALTRL